MAANGFIFAVILEQVQHTIQINLLPHTQLVFGLGQVVEQELQHDGAAKAPALDFEVGETARQTVNFQSLKLDSLKKAMHTNTKWYQLVSICGGK